MELTLHIGAHRTGSTLVAQAITQSVAQHPTCGVAVWHPRTMRNFTGFQSVPRWVSATGDAVSPKAAAFLARTRREIEAAAQREHERGICHLVLSEENLLGTMRSNMSQSGFYPDVAQRLRAYGQVLPQAPRRVALGLRDYGAVWSSAFHYSRQLGHAMPDRDVVRAVMLEGRRGWIDIIQDVYSVWPDAEIYIWQQEDLHDHGASICAGLLGLSVDQVTVPAVRINGLKAGAQRKPLFSEGERRVLRARYEGDMGLLRGVDPLGARSSDDQPVQDTSRNDGHGRIARAGM